MKRAQSAQKKAIQAVAFDIDGTLYSSTLFNIIVAPHFISHLRFFLHYNKVRKILHRTAVLPDFFEYQARLLADELNCSSEKAHDLIQSRVYDGLVPLFKILKPYPHVNETFRRFKENGLKLGILSDFPPEQKGDIWGTGPICDVVMGSEKTGALKPSVYTFGTLAQELGVPAENILYVGNSKRSDVRGAKAAGMQTAWKMPLWRALLHIPYGEADLSFWNYRTLQRYVLK